MLINCSEEARRGEPGYVKFLQQKLGSWNIRKLLLLKENQVSQVQELVLFYVWEDAAVYAH